MTIDSSSSSSSIFIPSLSVISWNAQGLCQNNFKWTQLQLLCDHHKPIAILIQDHRLNTDHQYKIKGYNIVYVNRHLLNIIRDDVEMINLTQYNSSVSKKLYTSWMSIRMNYHDRRLLLCNTYRLPFTSTVVEERVTIQRLVNSIETVMNQFNYSDIIVIGDFNSHSIHWSNKSHSSGDELYRQMNSINFQNLNEHFAYSEPTHTLGGVIDLAWTESLELIHSMNIDHEYLYSDHYPIVVNLHIQHHCNKQPRQL